MSPTWRKRVDDDFIKRSQTPGAAAKNSTRINKKVAAPLRVKLPKLEKGKASELLLLTDIQPLMMTDEVEGSPKADASNGTVALRKAKKRKTNETGIIALITRITRITRITQISRLPD